MTWDWVSDLSLADVKTRLKRDVDTHAENISSQVLTPGFYMTMIYTEKFAQAGAVAAMGEAAANALGQPDREAQFPTLSASVGIEGAALFDCAQLVLTKYARFVALSLHIERARLTGKAAIAAASDLDGVRSAYGAIVWPTP